MASDLKQFSGSRLKIQRANSHIMELSAIFESFLKSNFCELRVEKDGASGNEMLKVVSIGSLPALVPLIMGDAVHNLRTALDYVTGQIIGPDDERVTFPLVKRRDSLEKSSAMGLIKKAVPELADYILNNVEAHDTGHPSIWAAGRLDNIDKHKLLIPIVSVHAVRDIRCVDQYENTVSVGIASVGEGGVVNVARMTAPINITSHGTPAAQILFAKGQPLEGQPVIPALMQMSKRVAQTVEALEAFWFGEKPKG